MTEAPDRANPPHRTPLGAAAARPSNATWLSLLGGTLFLAIFGWAYDALPYETYAVRDDGVITMSHAVNWVDYGFIGINPSGPRVEGTSAPVEFFLYAGLYRFFGIRYDTYANLQTLVASFLLGALFVRFFRDRPGIALPLTALAAFLLTQLGSFFLWHGSGLENAVTHVLFLATVYLLFRCLETGRIRFAFAPVVFLATISRLESVVHIAPLLVLFAFAWLIAKRSAAGFAFGFFVFSLWSAFQAWRYFYFGSLSPNTAVAQDISLQNNLLLLWKGDLQYIRTSIQTAHQILLHHGAYVLLLFTPPLWLLRKRRSGDDFLLASVFILTATTALHPFLFGTARLGLSRTTTHLALFTVLGITLFLIRLLQRKRRVHFAMAAAVASLCALYFHRAEVTARRPICCNIPDFEHVRLALQRAAERELLPRPSVATFDIGWLSWHKRFNLFDLGRLGSPLLAKLRHGPALRLFLLDYAAPDMISGQGGWSELYRYSLFLQPAFRQRYKPLLPPQTTTQYYDHYTGALRTVPQQIWIRRAVTRDAGNAERRLIDAMRAAPSIELLARELSRCQKDVKANCAYVARTAYRYRPELVGAGQRAELARLFASSRTRALDLYLLDGARDPSLRDPALRHVMEDFFAILESRLQSDNLLARSGFDLYAWGSNLIYDKEPCGLEDALRSFRLRGVFFSSEMARREFSARNLLQKAPYKTFQLRNVGYAFDHRCVAILPLERQGSMLLETGQLDWDGESRWEATISHHFSEPGKTPVGGATPDRGGAATAAGGPLPAR